MERRLSVLAGPSRKALTAWIALGAIVASVSPAVSAPKGRAAKAAFKRGVTAYQKGDFAAASAALEKSFELESDVETLFAWAQAERQQDRCDKAIELYDKLLELDMPDENKDVVRSKRDECKAIVAAKTGVIDQPAEPEPAPDPEPQPERDPEPEPRISRPEEGDSPWWKDPAGDALLGAGLIGVGIGSYYLISGFQAEQDAQTVQDHMQFGKLQDKAKSHGTIGVIAASAGGLFVVASIVRYATRSSRKESSERATITGWVAPEGGGLAAFGRF